MTRSASVPPVIVIFGDEPFEKSRRIAQVLDRLLPPDVDRAMALCVYDGARREDQNGPTFAAVADDLRTLPFLADRRVVLVRDAEGFVGAAREKLEKYVAGPAPTSTLVLECRSFPKTTRLYKAIAKAGGVLHECRKLSPRDAVDYVMSEAHRHGKPIEPDAAARLVELIGPQQGTLANEVEKLSLYVGDSPVISSQDVSELVGLTREEKIFAATDAALLGRTSEALRLWQDVLASDPAGIYKALGGMAFVIRRLLAAHRMVADGMPIGAVAPKVMMFRRERELEDQLERFPPARLEALLGELAELDRRVKLGLRSLEHGVEAILINLSQRAA